MKKKKRMYEEVSEKRREIGLHGEEKRRREEHDNKADATMSIIEKK